MVLQGVPIRCGKCRAVLCTLDFSPPETYTFWSLDRAIRMNTRNNIRCGSCGNPVSLRPGKKTLANNHPPV